MITTTEIEWRCRSCNVLLGTEFGGRVYVRIRKLQYLIGGKDYELTAVCSRCSRINELRTSKGVTSEDEVPGE